MTDPIARARELLEFDDRAKTLEAEFRHACYPDADKEELTTMIADYACHGFASGVGVKFDKVRPMIEAALEVVKAAEGYAKLINYEPHDAIVFALARFAKAVEEM